MIVKLTNCTQRLRSTHARGLIAVIVAAMCWSTVIRAENDDNSVASPLSKTSEKHIYSSPVNMRLNDQSEANEIVQRYAYTARKTGKQLLRTGYIRLRAVDATPSKKDLDELKSYARSYGVAAAVTGYVMTPGGIKEEVVLASVVPRKRNIIASGLGPVQEIELTEWFPKVAHEDRTQVFKAVHHYQLDGDGDSTLTLGYYITGEGEVRCYEKNVYGEFLRNKSKESLIREHEHEIVNSLRRSRVFNTVESESIVFDPLIRANSETAIAFKLANEHLVDAAFTEQPKPEEMRLHALWNGKTYLSEHGLLLNRVVKGTHVTLAEQFELMNAAGNTHLPTAIVGDEIIDGNPRPVIIALAERVWNPKQGKHDIMLTMHNSKANEHGLISKMEITRYPYNDDGEVSGAFSHRHTEVHPATPASFLQDTHQSDGLIRPGNKHLLPVTQNGLQKKHPTIDRHHNATAP